MGTRVVTAGALSMVVALGAAAPADAAKRRPKPSCSAKGSETVARGSGVRVFTLPGKGDVVQRLYGCVAANGRKQLLTESSDDQYVTSSGFGDVRLSGRYVAWHSSATDVSCKADCPAGYDATSESVIVHDLVRRRTARRAVVATYTARSLVLTQRGAVAWLSGDKLLAADRRGTRVLDTGTIAPSSVRAEISIVSWLRDGVERFARLD